MGFLDRLLGREEPQQPGFPSPQQHDPRYTAPSQQSAGQQSAGQQPAGQQAPSQQPGQPAQRTDDEIAVERYRYLLRTAPPETIEQVHEEAFMKLSPEQRRILFTQLSQEAAPGDAPRGDDPHSLAQSATRSEIRKPGTMERAFAGAGAQDGGGGRGQGGGMGFGGMVASSLLGTVAGYVIGSALVSAFLPPMGFEGGDQAGAEGGTGAEGADGQAADAGSTEAGAADAGSADAGAGDPGAGDVGAGDVGADGGGWGDFGGGGGDFGGGDFGGGFDF
jgi:hypothetical protein